MQYSKMHYLDSKYFWLNFKPCLKLYIFSLRVFMYWTTVKYFKVHYSHLIWIKYKEYFCGTWLDKVLPHPQHCPRLTRTVLMASLVRSSAQASHLGLPFWTWFPITHHPLVHSHHVMEWWTIFYDLKLYR